MAAKTSVIPFTSKQRIEEQSDENLDSKHSVNTSRYIGDALK